MTVVLDASVIVKWLFQNPRREAGTEQATDLMEQIAAGSLPVLEPPHWLAEVGAVLARQTPSTAADDMAILAAMELPVSADPLALRRGIELSIELRQHLFDTYYHAVALENPDTVLITADDHYLRAARGNGRIVNLMDWK